MEIHHFSHNHPLVLKNFKDCEICVCDACCSNILEFAYSCDKCNFKIHVSCAEQPREMVHPFHPQHTLSLHSKVPHWSGTFDCDVCGLSSIGFTFHCSDCKFDMDLNCATLMPTITKTNKTHQHNLQKNHSHPHPLTSCDNKINSVEIKCSCCGQPIIKSHQVFVCLECQVLLHESCAGLPQEIQHPFHPSHPLTLLVSPLSALKCNACGDYLGASCYDCSQCDFVIHVGCALLTPTSSNDNKSIQDSHPHPLIPCCRTKNNFFPLSCSGCILSLEDEDYVYVCFDCKKLLHESCARLPREVEHPFHPAHSLKLDDYNTSRYSEQQSYECAACMEIGQEGDGFVYKCKNCRFYLHIRCTSPLPPFINSQLHQKHPLAFLDIKTTSYCCVCKLSCYYPIFRCMDCRKNFHAHCLSGLPPTIKHECHLHSLTLTHSPIKDYEDEGDDSEFYCDTCEKERRLYDPTYYCVECHYVAHVHCVISEVLPYMQRASSLGDKRGLQWKKKG